MSFSNSVVPMRAHTPSTRSDSNFIRRTILATVASALTIGLVFAGSIPAGAATSPPRSQTTLGTSLSTPVALAAPAQVATTAKAIKSKVTVSVNKKSYVEGKKGATLKIHASVAGKKASGTAKIYNGKKKLGTVKVHNGRASYTLPKNLSAKKHTITVRFFPASAAKRKINTSSKKVGVQVISRGDHIAKVAKKYVGVKYRRGGITPRGFDCSGFTSYVYKEAGVKKLPTSSAAQRHVGKVIPRSKAKPGDLIWTPGHVAIYLGGNKQIDAPRPGKTIQVRSIWQSKPKFIRV